MCPVRDYVSDARYQKVKATTRWDECPIVALVHVQHEFYIASFSVDKRLFGVSNIGSKTICNALKFEQGTVNLTVYTVKWLCRVKP